MIGVVCAVVAGAPIGTDPGLVQRVWMLVSGRRLETRGAAIPGLSPTGVSEPAVGRAWAAPGPGDGSSGELLACWREQVEPAGVRAAHEHEGYRPVAVDATGSWRPRRPGCATSHHHGPAGEALPASPVGIVARAGSVGTQRPGPPLAPVRAGPAAPSPAAHERALLRAAAPATATADAPVGDAGVEIRHRRRPGG